MRTVKKYSLFLLLLFAITAVGGAVYKSVDEKGAIKYSDKPPPGQKSQAVSVTPSPSPEEVKKAQDNFQFLMNGLHQREQQREEEGNNSVKQQNYCDYLRSLLVQLGLPGNFSTPIEGGRVLVVSPQGKPALRQRIEEELNNNC